MLNNQTPRENETTLLENEEEIRKPYVKPQLEEIGDLRTLTLGSSPFDTPDSNMLGMFDNT